MVSILQPYIVHVHVGTEADLVHTVDREIFVVKNFSSTTFSDEN